MTESADRTLLRDLRWALNRLYDPAGLRSSRLADRLGIGPGAGRVVALRRILTQGIEALKPDKATPPEANAWRIYRVLVQRFVEQSPQPQVAMDMALGIRQYRRVEAQAISVLADYLRAHYDLQHDVAGPAALSTRQDASLAEAGSPSREQELAWLAESLPSESVDAAEVVQAALEIARPLARAAGVRLECELPPDLPRLAGQPVTLRQALLMLLTAAVRSVPGGHVQIRAVAQRWEIALDIGSVRRQGVAVPQTLEDKESLEMARQLAGLLGGTLVVGHGDGDRKPFVARLSLPAVEQLPVLVVDDNVDTLQLLQRYLSGTRYRFIGVRDPEQALALVEEISPQIIVLDVMLPQIDGWELLGRLREHPRTCAVPIIVCTILPQEQLALSLGAAGFVRKPVSRSEFLAALRLHLDAGP